MVRTQTGITLTTRLSGESGASFSGTEADLGSLVQKAAENVFGGTQPYRYAVYLGSHGRPNEAFEVYRNLAKAAPERIVLGVIWAGPTRLTTAKPPMWQSA